jgi:hypothetical protein
MKRARSEMMKMCLPLSAVKNANNRVTVRLAEPRQVKEGSIWASVKGRFQMSQLINDKEEFANLFTTFDGSGRQEEARETGWQAVDERRDSSSPLEGIL